MLSQLHTERQATLDAFEWTWGNYNPANLLLFAAYSDAFNTTMEIIAAIDRQIDHEISLITEQATTEQPTPLLHCYRCGSPTARRCLQCREPICWNNELFGYCLSCWARKRRGD